MNEQMVTTPPISMPLVQILLNHFHSKVTPVTVVMAMYVKTLMNALPSLRTLNASIRMGVLNVRVDLNKLSTDFRVWTTTHPS